MIRQLSTKDSGNLLSRSEGSRKEIGLVKYKVPPTGATALEEYSPSQSHQREKKEKYTPELLPTLCSLASFFQWLYPTQIQRTGKPV